MNEILLLLDILEAKFPNKIPLGLNYGIDSFRVKQGQQNVIATVHKYLEKMKFDLAKKKK